MGGKLVGLMMGAVSRVTDGQDAIDSLYDSLPTLTKRRYGTTATERARALWENAGHVNWDIAVRNLINDELVDLIYGTVGQVGRGASRRLGGRPLGIQSGPLH